MFNLTDICRLCLKNNTALINMHSIDDDNEKWSEKLSKVVPEIDLFEVDLPCTLCKACCTKLKFTTEFKEMCIESNNVLKMYNAKLIELPNKPDNEIYTAYDDSSEHYFRGFQNEPATCSLYFKYQSALQNVIEGNSQAPSPNAQLTTNVDLGTLCDADLHSDDENKFTSTELNAAKENVRGAEEPPKTNRPKSKEKEECKENDFILTTVIEKLTEFLSERSNEGKSSDDAAEETVPKIEVVSTPKLEFANEEDVQNKVDPLSDVNLIMKTQKRRATYPDEMKINKCHVCDKRFRLKSHLREHIRIHTGEKPYLCKECGRAFRILKDLTVHNRYHTGEKPLVCIHCGCRFRQQSQLTYHLRKVHTGEKPFKCELCEAAFPTHAHLKYHILIHNNQKPYKCDTCDHRFRQLGHLKIHNRTHTGEKPFKCEVCNRSFTQFWNMRKHRARHTKEEMADLEREPLPMHTVMVKTEVNV